MSEQNTFRMSGQIRVSETGEPVQEVLVSVRDKNYLLDLGSAFTDEFGRYDVNYSQVDFPDFFEGRPKTFIVVKLPNGSVHFTSNEHVLFEAEKDIRIDVNLPLTL